MRRLIGIALILHGLAHAGAGIWATSSGSVWLITVLWWIAMAGFVAAGSGLLGVPRLDRFWRPLSVVASLASLGVLAANWHPILMIGAAIDAVLLIDCVPVYHEIISRTVGVPVHPTHRRLATLGTSVTMLLVLNVSTVVLTRPWVSAWGATEAERAMTLPGDELAPDARYVLDHAITIRAPADAVWPWLAQIGQDRAGFYSYDWLERLVGDPVQNADRLVPEWQSVNKGDLVRAAPDDYLGGLLGRNLGWRIADVVPGRALVLDGWGAFVLLPIDDTTTRFIVRTRGAGEPSLSAVSLAPFGLLLFEPAHFIMQRGMLLGVKERAEHAWRARGPHD